MPQHGDHSLRCVGGLLGEDAGGAVVDLRIGAGDVLDRFARTVELVLGRCIGSQQLDALRCERRRRLGGDLIGPRGTSPVTDVSAVEPAVTPCRALSLTCVPMSAAIGSCDIFSICLLLPSLYLYPVHKPFGYSRKQTRWSALPELDYRAELGSCYTGNEIILTGAWGCCEHFFWRLDVGAWMTSLPSGETRNAWPGGAA